MLKFEGNFREGGILSHYIGDKQSGNLFIVRFLRPEANLEGVRKAVTCYVAKYVLKNKSETDLDYRAVKGALNLRPFSTSKNLFSRTVLRKVKNAQGEKLFKHYSIAKLTNKLQSGEMEIRRLPLKAITEGVVVEVSDYQGVPWIEERSGTQEVILKENWRLEVIIKGETYFHEGGHYYVSQKSFNYEADNEGEKEPSLELPFVL